MNGKEHKQFDDYLKEIKALWMRQINENKKNIKRNSYFIDDNRRELQKLKSEIIQPIKDDVLKLKIRNNIILAGVGLILLQFIGLWVTIFIKLF